MDTRERLDLLNELPIDFAHSDLSAMPADLPFEMSYEIMQRAPTKLTLFMQASSYWRSHYYLQQLKIAVTTRYREEETRILATVLMNHELLTKDQAKPYLPHWIHYLKKRYGYAKGSSQTNSRFQADTKDMPIKLLIYAQALLIILEDDRSDKRLEEFDWLSGLLVTDLGFCQSAGGELCCSLRLIVAKARGVKSVLRELTLKELVSLPWVSSVYEAQLILAPYSLDLWDACMKSLLANNGPAQKDYNWPLRKTYLLHALVKLMPKSSHFMQQYQETFVELTQKLPMPVNLIVTDNARMLRCARMDLIATLVRCLPPRQDPWSQLVVQVDDMTDIELALFDELRKVKSICALTNDAQRVSWLKTLFCTTGYDDVLFAFAKRECLKLTSNEAKTTVIDHLLKFIGICNAGLVRPITGNEPEKFYEKIKSLVNMLEVMGGSASSPRASAVSSVSNTVC